MYWASHLARVFSHRNWSFYLHITLDCKRKHSSTSSRVSTLTWRERQQNLRRTRSEAFSARHVWIIHSSYRDLVSHVTLLLRVRTPSRPICHSNCILLLRASIYCTWWKSNWMLLRGLNVWPSRRLMNLAELCFNVWRNGAGGVRYKNSN